MKQTSVFRVTAEICFYYSVLNVFGAFCAWRLPMALLTAACLLLGLVIVRCRSAPVRLLLAILPVLCFLAGPFSLLMIVPLFAWVYYLFVMARGHYAMPLEEYRKIFTFMLVVSLFFIAANIANSTIFLNQLISVDSLVYTAAFLFLGVFAMRRMQMGAEMGPDWQIRNILSMVGVPLLAVGVSLVLFLVLRFSHQALTAVLVPVGRFFIWLFSKLFPTGNAPVEEMTLEEYMNPRNASAHAVELELGAGNRNKTPSGSQANPLLIERAAAIGGWVLLGILLLVALLLIWRHARRNRPAEEEELLYEEAEMAPADGKRRRRGRGIPLLAGNARQLRRIYKTYLEYKKAMGMRVNPSDTSAEILERDREEGKSGDAAKLRDLYIAARYGDPSGVTREQVQEAQACLERIVG